MHRPTATSQVSHERAFLVGAELKRDRSGWTVEESLDELAQLADTAGAQVVGRLSQKLDRLSPSYYLGTGKLQELVARRSQAEYEAVIFDDELTPTQQRNLEEILQCKIIDRTALVLDIFAQRAQTREGQLQVELAQYEYLLPRLAGKWTHLERLGAGIGTRGPGESQLETDRRLVRHRISQLNRLIEDVRRHRNLYRIKRKKAGIPLAAIVGYTNTGKSTLLNSMSNAEVLVEDKLFATLDPTTRRVALPDHRQVLVTDTVGFIQKLPPAVVAAFKATLEELEEADLLLHVLDASHPSAAQQQATVEQTLSELGLLHKPRLVLLNKLDRILEQHDVEMGLLPFEMTSRLGLENRRFIAISAAKGWGLSNLLHAMLQFL